MTVFYNIAKNTFRECIRTNVFFVLLFTCYILVGLFPLFALFAFNEQYKMIIDSSMAASLFFGLLVSILLASHSFYFETANGTILLLTSKPVARWKLVLGKTFGILIVLTFFILTCSFAAISSISISISQFTLNYYNMAIFYSILTISALWGAFRDYFYRKTFTESACFALLFLSLIQILQNIFFPIGYSSSVITQLQLKLIPAFILLLFAIWIIGSITVVLSTRFSLIINLLITFPIYILGLISNYYIAKNIPHSFIFKILYAIIPNWQLFWLADAISNNKEIPFNYIFWALMYTVLYVSACTLIAILCFRTKETGKQNI